MLEGSSGVTAGAFIFPYAKWSSHMPFCRDSRAHMDFRIKKHRSHIHIFWPTCSRMTVPFAIENGP